MTLLLEGMIGIPEDELTARQHDMLERRFTPKDKDGVPCPVWSESDGFVWVPRSYLADVRSEGISFVDNTSDGYSAFGQSNAFIPREGQSEAVEGMARYLRAHWHGVLVAECGSGKSIVGAQLAYTLGVSTVVLVHRQFLEEQWIENFKVVCPDVRIGIVRGKRCEHGPDYDVVIASCQSLAGKREYPASLYRGSGLLIADEVHIYSARHWSRIIGKFLARYRLGLTATFRRSDGLIDVIRHHVGDVAYVMKSTSMKADVYFLSTYVEMDPREYVQVWNNEINQAWLKTKLAKVTRRNHQLIGVIRKAAKAGRKCLILSERRQQLEDLATGLVGAGVNEDDIGFLLGGMKEEKRRESSTKQVIFSTYQLARNALDIEDLDVLVMGTPIGDIQQTVGRVVRRIEGKKTPIVVDLIDSIPYCEGLARNRKKQYEALGYKVCRGRMG